MAKISKNCGYVSQFFYEVLSFFFLRDGYRP